MMRTGHSYAEHMGAIFCAFLELISNIRCEAFKECFILL